MNLPVLFFLGAILCHAVPTYTRAMTESPSPLWSVQADLRPDRQDPYFRILSVTVFVRDQDRSLQFYVDRLGFSLVADYPIPNGTRWVSVAPPDGTAILALIAPKPGDEEFHLIGQARQITFLTDDVQTKYRDTRDFCGRASAPLMYSARVQIRSAASSRTKLKAEAAS
jgi:catechol 2,3-dioxygenase-like lactoylglutathione lyase family enzyme